MAETYSTEYTVILQSTPGSKTFAYGNPLFLYPFHYTQAALGAINDTIILARLGPKAILRMDKSFLSFVGFSASTTLSLGWKAYRDVNGATVAASAAGLLSAISIATDGAWNSGMLVVATPDDSVPVVWEKDFNNMDPVLIFATIAGAAPGAADVLNGGLYAHHA